MLAQDQREQARKLFAYLDTQTTANADTVYRNEVVDYTCRKQFARERELFFRRAPLFVGLSCLLPRPGDYMLRSSRESRKRNCRVLTPKTPKTCNLETALSQNPDSGSVA